MTVTSNLYANSIRAKQLQKAHLLPGAMLQPYTRMSEAKHRWISVRKLKPVSYV